MKLQENALSAGENMKDFTKNNLKKKTNWVGKGQEYFSL